MAKSVIVLSVKVDKEMYERIDNISMEFYHGNISETVRNLVISGIEEHETVKEMLENSDYNDKTKPLKNTNKKE